VAQSINKPRNFKNVRFKDVGISADASGPIVPPGWVAERTRRRLWLNSRFYVKCILYVNSFIAASVFSIQDYAPPPVGPRVLFILYLLSWAEECVKLAPVLDVD